MVRRPRSAACAVLTVFALLISAPSSKGQTSYRNSLVSRASHPLSLETPIKLDPPYRFLGWKYSFKQGPKYAARFQRPRADLAIPQPKVPPSPELPQTVPKALLGSATAGLPGFQLRPTIPAGLLPTGVATADFNGDGHIDWVVANGGDNTVWVYLGTGGGGWQLPTIIPLLGLAPVWVVTADLRGNGVSDIIVAEADSGTVGVLLGKGDGTFAPETEYFLNESPLSLAVADFNGDGKIDIMAGVYANSVDVFAVLPNVGNGQLGSPIISTAPTYPALAVTDISLGDINGDGVPDAVISAGSAFGNALLSFLGQGDGTFVPGQVVASTIFDAYYTAALGDINGDGCKDIVTTDAFGYALTYPGSCDGNFGQPTYFTLGDVALSLALEDLNNDGHLDIVAGSVYQDPVGYGDTAGDLLSVMLGDGKGNFGQASVYRGEPFLVGLAFADLNGDGYLDVVSANQNTDSASVFLNDGNGGFGAPNGYAVGYNFGVVNSPVTGLISTDLDGDGKKDLALLELPASSPGNYQLTALLGQGNGRFGPLARYNTYSTDFYTPGDFVLADFRNTGHPDFLSIGAGPAFSFSTSYISFAPNNGDGTFGPAVNTNPPTADQILAVGDFNQDGKLDFVAIGNGNSSNVVALNVFLGNGDGTFNPSPSVYFGGGTPRFPVSVYAGDFNHDGKLDILTWLYYNVVPFSANDVYEFLGNGDGTFQTAVKIFSNSDPITMADVNRDGMPDLVTCKDPEANYPSNDQPPVISVHLGQPDGTFSLAHTYQPYASSFVYPSYRGTANGGGGMCTVADFNGDGNPDVAVFQRVTGGPIDRYVQFLMGNGDGSFTPTYDIYRFHKLSSPQFAFDVNGDGVADLVELDAAYSSFDYLPGGNGAPFQIGLFASPAVGVGELQITLDVPSASSTTVTLSASDPKITIPATVTIPAGSVSQVVDFGFAAGFNPYKVFSITGTSNGHTATTYGTEDIGRVAVGVVLGLNLPNQGIIPGQSSGDYGPSFGSIGGYTTTLTFSCSGLPPQAQCNFNPDTVYIDPSGGGLISLIVTTTSAIPPKNYNFNVVATDGAITVTTPGTLDVIPNEPDLGIQGNINQNAASVGNVGMVDFYIDNNGPATADNVQFTYAVAGPVQVVSPQSGCTITPPVCNLGSIQSAGRAVVAISVMPNSVGNASVQASVSELETDINPADNSTSVSFSTNDFSMQAVNTSATIAAGQMADYTLNFATVGTYYSGAIYVSCNGLPANSSCYVVGSPVSLGPTPTASATLQITTSARRQAEVGDRHSGLYGLLLPVMIVPFGLVLNWRRQPLRWAWLVTGTLMVALLISCGGGSAGSSGSGGGGGGGGTGAGTPPGTYSVVVQGTSGTDVKSVNLTLVVQ